MNEDVILVQAGVTGGKIFGNVLKDLREKSMMSAQQLADATGFHASFIRSIERGSQSPSMETAKIFLDHLVDQEHIVWADRELPYDVIIHGTQFKFKAAMRGQNNRISRMPSELEVQMRSDEGALYYRDTVRGAMAFAKEHSDIWKISWTDSITGERIRLVRKHVYYPTSDDRDSLYEAWVYEPILPDDILGESTSG